ncbi:MAG: ATP-binding protein, partial [Chloroflexi bacterium]|nr:ATP-binding protein [Chloroflexota bacterium]
MLPDFRVRQRDYLLEISRALTEELDLDRVLDRIARISAELLGGHACLIVLRHEQGWRVSASHGINLAFLEDLRPLLADIPDHGDPERFELPEVNRRLQRITQAASMGLLTGVGLPLIAHQEIVGVIFVFRSYAGVFSAEDRALLQGFAAQAAIAVHNARLYTAVSAQKQDLATVLESSADGIFILDPRMRFVGFNRACSKLTGFPADEAIGQEHSQVIRWLRREPGLGLEEAVAGGWPLSAQATLYEEGDLLRHAGEPLSVGITYAPALSPEGKLRSIVGNLRDISKFREAEEVKSTFISVISHELRTPVALIKGYVGTLRREDAQWDPAVVRDSLAVIEEESDHLAQLIDDLLDASRLQAGGMTLQKSDVSLDQLTARLADRFRTQTTRHEFVVDFARGFPVVVADEERMTQVLSNLISNAVKYSPEGGKITIRGHVRPNEVVISVADQGPGIQAQDAPRVFDRFYRSSDTARKTKGAGLG